MNMNTDFGFGPPPQYPAASMTPAAPPTPSSQQPSMEVVAGAAPTPRPANPEVNPATLCRIGQETVQEILTRTQDVFAVLKTLQPPNGTPSGAAVATERKARIQDQLGNVSLLMRRLRIVYDKCCDLTKDMDMRYTHVESLIPLKDEWDGKSEERKQTEAYRQAVVERAQLKEQVELLNKQLKEAVDMQRRGVWEINVMLDMRKS